MYVILLLVALIFNPNTSQILYQDSWSHFAKLGENFLFLLYVLFGYYMENTHEAYYAHIVLHGCLQMNTLIVYLRQEFRGDKKISLTDKINSQL